jgi:hypothetical protein
MRRVKSRVFSFRSIESVFSVGHVIEGADQGLLSEDPLEGPERGFLWLCSQ